MLLTLLPALLAALFAPWVSLTGDPQFRTRERGSAVLAATWPLSAPAIDLGLHSPDAEVRFRCRRATPSTWRADWAAAVLVGHRHIIDGLPLADPKREPRWSCWTDSQGTLRVIEPDLPAGVTADQLRRAVIRLADAHGVPTTDRFYFGESEFFQRPTGWNYVRVRLAGYPDWPKTPKPGWWTAGR